MINKYGGHEDQLSAKYKAMDYWRVWSMMSCLSKNILGPEKKKALLEVSKAKSKILMDGYLKHDNMDNYNEVKNWASEIDKLSN